MLKKILGWLRRDIENEKRRDRQRSTQRVADDVTSVSASHPLVVVYDDTGQSGHVCGDSTGGGCDCSSD